MAGDDADPFDLRRFTAAQERVHAAVREELTAGRKRSHWMWFVFPQVAGLGHSATAQRFAIRSLGEAEAYLAHPVLGARLEECTHLVLAHRGVPAHDIFGDPDTMKFRSSMTLFAASSPERPSPFREALDVFFEGEPDGRTLAILRRQG